jgi:ATP-dependent exoDNAse (exonuclease V) alpha subunit
MNKKNAVKILNERNSVFTEKNLIDTALKNGLGKTNFENITKEIETLKQKSLLLTCSKLGLDNFLATKISLETELKIIEFTKESLKPENHITPIYSKDEIKELNNIKAFGNLNKNQKQACNFILNSPESVIAIQGYAGTGKTHMLETTAKILAGKNVEILGFAPTGTAVKELENVGIKSRTLQWFLGNYDKVINGRITIERRDSMKQELKNKIIVVDEASRLQSNFPTTPTTKRVGIFPGALQ